MIHRDRLTASIQGAFVVFLIGMRFNSWWKLHRWLPVAQAMLGGEMWFGRTTILVQYWRSMDQLMAFATNREAAHLPAWKSFNQSVAKSGDVGVWHETYSMSPGTYENVYVNMPPFGLGKVGTLKPASGTLSTAQGRVRASGL